MITDVRKERSELQKLLKKNLIELAEMIKIKVTQ